MRLQMIFCLFSGLLAFAHGVVAQQEMPECAASCLKLSLAAQSVCAFDDIPCICTDGPLNTALQACVGQSCTAKEVLTTLNVTTTMCDRPIHDNTKITNILCGVTSAAALIAVIIRTVNTINSGTFDKDDACALLAGVFVIVDNAVTFTTGPAGFGRDTWTVPFDNIYFILKMIYLMQVFYWPISALTKMAFLFFYLRIFPHAELRRWIIVTMGLTFCYWASFQFGNIFYCKPVSHVWNGWDGEHSGHCLNINHFMVSASAVNIFIDIIIIILPIPELLRLRLSWRKKVGLIAMFLVGGFTLIVSILRVQKVMQYEKSKNPLYDNVPAGYWSLLEVNVATFCVCMPAMRKALSSYLPRIFGSTQDSKEHTYSPSGTPMEHAKPSRKRTPTFGGSLFNDTIITKTVTTNVSIRGGEDDRISLVDMRRPKPVDGESQSQISRDTERSKL